MYSVFLCAVVRLVMILFTNGKQKDRAEEINVEQDLKTVLYEGIIYSVVLTFCAACLAMRSGDVLLDVVLHFETAAEHYLKTILVYIEVLTQTKNLQGL